MKIRTQPTRKLSKPNRISQTSGEARGPRFTPDGDHVVFSSGQSEPPSRELYKVNLNNGEQVALTDREVNLSWQAAPSAKDGKLVYVVEKEGNSDLHVMNSAGTQNRNITNTNKGYWNPTWSPDGETIVAVSRDNPEGNLELISMKADGSQKTQLTSLGMSVEDPIFSMDGSHIVFGLAPGMGSMVLASIKADGSDLKTYARHLNLNGAPDISASGQIVFSAYGADSKFGIYSVDLNDEQSTEQLVEENYSFSPKISPDGKKFTYISADKNFDFQVHERNVDGTGDRILTETGSDNSSPSYSPDGKSIVYLSKRDEEMQVYLQELG